MNTLKYPVTKLGLVVATGEGDATFTPKGAVEWGITEAGTIPDITARHVAEVNADKSMTLASGESLVIWATGVNTVNVAVTAENPAAGNI